MTTEQKATTIDIGTIETARELVFTQGHATHRYVLQAPGIAEDYLAFTKRHAAYDVRRTTSYYIDDTDGSWFACYNVDCFDPPFAIIRARNFEDAYETFCDEFSDWLKVDETDAADYPEDERNYSASGVHIDTSNVQIHPLHLERIELTYPEQL